MLHGAFNLGLGLRREARRSHANERARQLRKKREVDVKRGALKSPHPLGQQRPLVLEAAELALDGGTASVELRQRGVSRGTRGYGRSAASQRLAGRHSPEGSAT
jgi:hypothetical protein